MKIEWFGVQILLSNYSRQAQLGIFKIISKKIKVVGISDVDTRAIVQHIRDKGAMNAIISSEELDVEILKKNWLRYLQWKV